MEGNTDRKLGQEQVKSGGKCERKDQ